MFPAERVELRCAMEPSSDWTYTWYKDGHVVQADDDVSFDSNRANLSIKSSSAKHEGQYNCKGHLEGRSVLSNFGSGLTLTVYGEFSFFFKCIKIKIPYLNFIIRNVPLILVTMKHFGGLGQVIGVE